MLLFIISFWIIVSWNLRQCESYLYGIEFYYSETYTFVVHEDFIDAVWVIIIPFLAIGYGDIVPSTYCGRSIAIFTVIMVRSYKQISPNCRINKMKRVKLLFLQSTGCTTLHAKTGANKGRERHQYFYEAKAIFETSGRLSNRIYQRYFFLTKMSKVYTQYRKKKQPQK